MNSYNDCKTIVELDLDPIKVKLMHRESGEGWTLEQASAVEAEYRRFLYLMKMFPNEAAAPLADVDTFWHYHILDTLKYAQDCQAVFGYFLHHFPYIGLRGEDDLAAHERMGERMRELYEETFGEGYAVRPANSSAASTATAFSANIAGTAFSAATKSTAFSAATKGTAFSAATMATAFSAATKSTAASAAKAATAFSAATKGTAFSAATKGTAFSAATKGTGFSAATKGTAFSAATTATAFSAATVGTAFSASTITSNPESMSAKDTGLSGFFSIRPRLETVV